MTPPSQPYISKSNFLMGRQCSKLLWFRYNAKEQIPAPDESAQAIFDQGTQVGELARSLFPDGILIAPSLLEMEKVLAETRAAIPQRA